MRDPEIPRTSEQKSGHQSSFFQPEHKTKPLKERGMAIECLKKQLWPQIKEELGDEYTQEEGEEFFSCLINSPEGESLIQKVLAVYLEEKIASERESFSGKNQNKKW
jgi:hypothetical protein